MHTHCSSIFSIGLLKVCAICKTRMLAYRLTQRDEMGLETICIEFMSCGDALRLYEQIHILNEIEVSDHQVTVSDVTTPSVTHI